MDGQIEKEQELFGICIEQPEEEWEELLVAQCDDEQLRTRVRILLERHKAVTRELHRVRPEDTDPERIGPYRILQRLGEGGMGIVYAAEQREPVRRRVAIKVLRDGYNNQEVLARFDAERHALSLMTHPNIAHILDAGTTADRRPYIVMEYVPGERITRYCEQRKLPLQERLQLFRSVCDAVQHAHQRGVIHRDIKPSNILVMEEDSRAIAKVIDFGIAKAVTQRLTEHTLETKVGSLLGTPDYMSPEQAELSPLDVDTRTDIYALGAVLYEILAGTPPLKLGGSGKSYLEMQRLIVEQIPMPPSHQLSGSARRQVRGELDWITLKALEKQRVRRYSTASEFSADLANFMHGRTVVAGPPSRTRELVKFANRHRAAVIATAILFAALVASQIMLLKTNLDLQEERKRVAAEAETAERVTAVVEDIFGAVNPDKRANRELSVDTLLQEGVNLVMNDHSLSEPVRARLLLVLGRAFYQLGKYQQAVDLLTAAREEAQRSAERLSEEQYILILAQLARAHSENSELSAAREVLEEGTKAVEASNLDETEATLRLQEALAHYYLVSRQLTEGVRILESLLPKLERRHGVNDEWTLSTMFNLATGYRYVGRLDESLELAEGILSLAGDLPIAADANLHVGKILYARGDLVAAGELFHKAEGMFSQQRGPLSVQALNAKLARALTLQNDAGLQLLSEVYSDYEQEFGSKAVVTLSAAGYLAQRLLEGGNHFEAMRMATIAQQGYLQLRGKDDDSTCELSYLLARAAYLSGEHAKARAALELALARKDYREKFAQDEIFDGIENYPDYRNVAGLRKSE